MKRFLSLFLTLSMLLTCISFSGMAAKNQAYEPTTQELEAIIKKVRTTVDIPEDRTEFSWDYNSQSYYSRSSWNLTWASEGYNSATYITCDSEGNITSYRTRNSDSKTTPTLPDKSPEAYLDKVNAFIAKIAPYTVGHLSLESAKISGTIRSNLYTYRFVRTEHGIIAPDNSVNVTLNYVTGEIMSANVDFDIGLEFPWAENVVTEQKAKELLSTAQSMKLSYRVKNEYDDEGKLTQRKAYLVYTPEVSYVSVDAITGEIYTQRNTWEIVNEAPSYSGSAGGGNLSFDKAEAEAATPDYQLSEKELAQLEVLNSLISREDAIKVVTGNKYLYLDESATAVEAQLERYTDYSTDQEKFTWRISFSTPYDEKLMYRSYANASIDAKTGELLSYSAGLPGFYDYTESDMEIPKLVYTQEQAEQIASEFLQSIVPEKFALTKKGTPQPVIVLDYGLAKNGEYDYNKPIYRGSAVSYIRVNENVDFSYNSLNTRVDLVTGKISTYRTTWYDDITFESPKDAITPEKALEIYHASKGFGLNYEINSNYTYNKYLTDEKNGELIPYDELYKTSLFTRPVYSAYNVETNIVGALTGKMLNYNGDEYTPKTAKSYTDIENHWARDIIIRFSYADIGFEGDRFEPDKNITADEFSKLLNSCSVYGSYYDYNTNETPDNNADITRAEAVKFIISYLGYGKVAELENVFITDFADNTSLKQADVGYIAIARGFGLINGDTTGFRPYDKLTRAESLQLCLNLLNTNMLD